MFYRTDDPVMDAESYAQDQEDSPHVYCETCGEKMYIGDSTHDSDDIYCIDGALMCEECARAWFKRQKVEPCS